MQMTELKNKTSVVVDRNQVKPDFVGSAYCGNCKHGSAKVKQLVLCSIDDDKTQFVWHSCRQWTANEKGQNPDVKTTQPEVIDCETKQPGFFSFEGLVHIALTLAIIGLWFVLWLKK
jgi:hypothetical protein